MGEISKVYAEHHDRLSRVASLTRLIEHLCRKHSVEIVALDREEDEDDMKSNLAELVECACHFLPNNRTANGGTPKEKAQP